MRPVAIRLAIATLMPCGVAAQSAPKAYSFYTISGQDTLAIEQVIRTDEQVDVDMLVREQRVRFLFTLELGPDATVRRVTNRFFRQPQDDEPTQIVTAAFRGDSVDVEISGNQPQTMTVGTLPGSLSWIFPSNTLLEQALLRSQALNGTEDVDSIPFFNIANGQSTTATIVWEGPDAATLRLAEATLSVELEEDGSVSGFSGDGRRVVREDAFGRLPIEEADYGPPEGAPYRAEEVTVRTPAGLSLSGTLARAFGEGGNEDVTVIRFADTNHLFLADPEGHARDYDELPSFNVPPEVLGAIADWLADRLESADRTDG